MPITYVIPLCVALCAVCAVLGYSFGDAEGYQRGVSDAREQSTLRYKIRALKAAETRRHNRDQSE